jgi:hypothetical protein
MKKKRFSVEQIVTVLKQAELGVPVAEVIRKVGISEQTFYRWKKQYVGISTATENLVVRSPISPPITRCQHGGNPKLGQIGGWFRPLLSSAPDI